MQITMISQITGNTHTREIDVTQDQINNWNGSGDLVQNAFPNLSDEDREFLMTGITPEEWNQYMKEPEEEDQ